jgi:hypothetical protein
MTMSRPARPIRHLTAAAAAGIACLAAASAAPPTDRASAVDVMERGSLVARALHDALRRNGTLADCEAGHRADPVSGGAVFNLQWLMADYHRMQRDAFRQLLADVDRTLAMPAGFARRRAVLDLLERMVAFRKTNWRFTAVEHKLPARSPSLAGIGRRFEASLTAMDVRVSHLQRMLQAAL